MSEMTDVLDSLLIRYTPSSEEIRISCPFCAKSRHEKAMGVNLKTGQFNCFKCGKKGRSAKSFYEQYTGGQYKPFNSEHSKEIEEVVNDPIRDEITRHKVNASILSMMKLYKEESKDLTARGFTASEIALLNYRSYPYSDQFNEELTKIPRKLIEKGLPVDGIPGIYVNRRNERCLKSLPVGTVTPCISINNRIKFLNVRVRKPINKNKCIWFSTKKNHHGCKAEAGTHYACDFDWTGDVFTPSAKDGTIILTEGIIKGDIIHLLTGKQVVAVTGVNVLDVFFKELPELVKFGFNKVSIAYDLDSETNKDVKKALTKVENFCKKKKINYERMLWQKETPDGRPLKGYDDYLMYVQRGILPKKRED